MVIGIDPGLDGAVAVVDPQGRLVGVWDTPATKPPGKRSFILPEMVGLILDLLDAARQAGFEVHLGLEKVGVRKGEGVAGAFSFGTGWGMWQGIAAALKIPTTLITPQIWKGKMMAGLDKSSKDSSRLRAMQLWPDSSASFKLKKHDGRAEAALIGEAIRLAQLGG